MNTILTVTLLSSLYPYCSLHIALTTGGGWRGTAEDSGGQTTKQRYQVRICRLLYDLVQLIHLRAMWLQSHIACVAVR